MAEEFVGVGIAVVVVTASIVLAGILIGLGRALGYKRIEYFGIEELVQSVINAAIIGSFAAIIGLVGAVSSSVVSTGCTQGDVVDQLICTLDGINAAIFGLFQSVAQAMDLIGYYQTLALDFGAFSIAPFMNLSSISAVLSTQLLSLNLLMILIGLNSQVAFFIKQNVLSLIFPVGLVLRTVFATRKVGGFLIALALGLYIFYPTFVLVFPTPQPDIANATLTVQNFTNNSYYAPVPVIDLNDNYAIAGKLDIMSGRCRPDPLTNYSIITNTSNLTECDLLLISQGVIQNTTNFTSNFTFQTFTVRNITFDFSGDLTLLTQSNSASISKSMLYALVAPLFSFLVTAVFVKELGSLLGSEIGLRTMASV